MNSSAILYAWFKLEVLRGKKLYLFSIISSPLPKRNQTGQMSMKVKTVWMFKPPEAKFAYYLHQIHSVYPLNQLGSLYFSPILVLSKYYWSVKNTQTWEAEAKQINLDNIAAYILSLSSLFKFSLQSIMCSHHFGMSPLHLRRNKFGETVWLAFWALLKGVS